MLATGRGADTATPAVATPALATPVGERPPTAMSLSGMETGGRRGSQGFSEIHILVINIE